MKKKKTSKQILVILNQKRYLDCTRFAFKKKNKKEKAITNKEAVLTSTGFGHRPQATWFVLQRKGRLRPGALGKNTQAVL